MRAKSGENSGIIRNNFATIYVILALTIFSMLFLGTFSISAIGMNLILR